jgi:hypothetical protein
MTDKLISGDLCKLRIITDFSHAFTPSWLYLYKYSTAEPGHFCRIHDGEHFMFIEYVENNMAKILYKNFIGFQFIDAIKKFESDDNS